MPEEFEQHIGNIFFNSRISTVKRKNKSITYSETFLLGIPDMLKTTI